MTCEKCGRPITTAASIEARMGPDCLAKVRLEEAKKMDEQVQLSLFTESKPKRIRVDYIIRPTLFERLTTWIRRWFTKEVRNGRL